MNPIKILLVIGMIVSVNEALAGRRQATQAEIQAWCEGRTSLNISVTNASKAQACTHYGFSTATAPQAEALAENRDAAAGVAPARETLAANDAATPPRGGNVTNSGECGDPALTAAIPSGRNSAPGFPTSQSAYREYATNQILSGNIPQHLRNLVPIQMGSGSSSCMGHTGPLTLCAMPEPIAIGGSDNYAYTNLKINDAVRIGRELGFILPTSYMVDAIDSAATVNVRSLTRPWWCGSGGDCSGGEPHRFQTQSTDVRNLVQGSGNYTPGALVSGAYKDYALSHRLTPRNGGYTHFSLYGWNGIQSGRDRLQHDSGHLDYSQVPRYMSQWVQVGDRWENMATLLEDSSCAAILNGGQRISSNVTGVFNNPNLRAPGGSSSPRGGEASAALAVD